MFPVMLVKKVKGFTNVNGFTNVCSQDHHSYLHLQKLYSTFYTELVEVNKYDSSATMQKLRICKAFY